MPVSYLPKGLNYARCVSALGLSQNDPSSASVLAAHRWGDASRPVSILSKANVGAGTTVTLDDGLAEGGATPEFFSRVAQLSIIGRLGLRRVPFQTPLIVQTTETAAEWTGEGRGKKVVAPAFTKLQGLARLKVAALNVFTKEFLAATEAETTVLDELVRAVVQALDVAFISPDNAGTDGVKPASVTHAAPDATGGSPASASFADDLEELIEGFTGDLASSYLITSPLLAAKLSGADRPNIGARGGEWGGIPVITSTLFQPV